MRVLRAGSDCVGLWTTLIASNCSRRVITSRHQLDYCYDTPRQHQLLKGKKKKDGYLLTKPGALYDLGSGS